MNVEEACGTSLHWTVHVTINAYDHKLNDYYTTVLL